MIDYDWHDFIGNFGVFLILIAYLLLQIGRMDPRALAYSALNALGAALILVSLWVDFNLSAFVIEVFWVLISLVGIARYLRKREHSACNT